MTASHLTRYWFEFEKSSPEQQRYLRRFGAAAGCGVTAYSKDDAMTLLKNCLFRDAPTPAVSKVHENVDVSTLDPRHVIPNMGVVVWRGVWFPNIGEC